MWLVKEILSYVLIIISSKAFAAVNRGIINNVFEVVVISYFSHISFIFLYPYVTVIFILGLFLLFLIIKLHLIRIF